MGSILAKLIRNGVPKHIAKLLDEDDSAKSDASFYGAYPKNALPGINLTNHPFELARMVRPWKSMAVPSPYNPSHVLHPSLQFFENGWRGYRFWMAYTPYPNSDSTYENPCVAASNDGESWTAMGAQPLVGKPTGGYNSDTDLYYDSASDQLVLLYRAAIGTTCQLWIMTSADGVKWSTPTNIYSAPGVATAGGSDIAAPSIWYNGTSGKWEIVGHNIQSNADAWPLVKITSNSLLSGWDTAFTTLTFPISATGRKWWHSQFRRASDGTIVGIAQDNAGALGGAGNIYVVRSDDGTNFYSALLDNTKSWYRPSFLILKDSADQPYLRVFGSQLNQSGIWSGIAAFDLGGTSIKVTGNNAAAATALVDLDETLGLGALLSAARGGSRGILIADDFNRADSASGVGNSLDGKTWVQTGGADVIGISGNRAYNVTTGNCRIVYDTSYADYLVRMTFAARSAGECYAVVRHQDTSNFIRVGQAGNSNQLKWEVISGGAVTLSETLGATPADGDEIKILCRGEFVLIFLRGSLLAMKRQSSLKTKTFVGIQMSGAAGQFVENFVATRLL